MKRFCLIFTVFCLLLGLSACGMPSGEEKPSVSVADPTATMPTHIYEAEEETELPTEETVDPMWELFVPGNCFASVYRTENGSVWATIIMEFTNISDTPLFFDYASIDLWGKDAEIVQVLESVAFSPQIIAPGETGYYCETVSLDTVEELSLTPKLSADFQGVTPVDAVSAAYEVGEYLITDSLYGGLVLQATVTNNTDTTGELVCVTAILKNAASEPVGFITNYLDSTLDAGASAEINFESFMLSPELSAESIADVEIIAFPVADLP